MDAESPLDVADDKEVMDHSDEKAQMEDSLERGDDNLGLSR